LLFLLFNAAQPLLVLGDIGWQWRAPEAPQEKQRY
jgi:hypothetical protein